MERQGQVKKTPNPKSLIHFIRLGDLGLSGFGGVASKGYHRAILQYYAIYVLAEAVKVSLLKGKEPLTQQHSQQGSRVLKYSLSCFHLVQGY